MSEQRWHRTLLRQLRRAGLDPDEAVHDASLVTLLDRVSAAYDDVDQERYLNDRAFALSGREMQDLYDELRRASDSELAFERDRLQAVFDAVATGLVVIDADGEVVRVNPAAELLLGLPSTSIVGRPVGDVVRPAADDGPSAEAIGSMRRAAAQARPWRAEEVQVRSQVVSSFAATMVFAPLLHRSAPGGGVLAITDISDRKAVEAELAWRATHDQLTGLLNRAAFHDRVGEALERDADRDSTVALLFLDLDRFKVVNDSLGHAAGDALLIAVAGRLASAVRDADRIARFGGDEFVVLVEPARGADDAMRVADRIVAALSAPLDLGGDAVFASASVGVSLARPGDTAESLLRNADVALYRAKERGRGRAVLFDPSMHDQVAERVRLERALRHALDADDLTVVYQPTWDADTTRLLGFEALVRWFGAEGPVDPAVFVTLAEDVGLVGLLGDWVLASAGSFLAALAQAGRPDLTVAVNLSAVQLSDDGLVERVAQTLSEWELPAGRLVLEVTETALHADPELARVRLAEMRQLGVAVALDDFGTGYSSFAALRDLPLDVLKIDRSFLTDVASSERDRAVVSAVVAVGRALGLSVVAEGVETEEQLVAVRDLGCDVVQGYLVGLPLPRDEALELARSGRPPDGRRGSAARGTLRAVR